MKPGEQPTNYSDEDDEPNTNTTSTTSISSEKTDEKVDKKSEDEAANKSDDASTDNKSKEEWRLSSNEVTYNFDEDFLDSRKIDSHSICEMFSL